MKVKQSIPKRLRYTMADFNAEFPDDSACLEYVKEQRWLNGVTLCAKCQIPRKHHRVTGRTAYACQVCGNHIYPLAGTVFEKSSTSLKTWFYAMYLMGSTRCGISAKQIQRETGVTYKTAWRMFRQIRLLLSDGDLQLEGPTVEVDESYYGGVRKWNRGRPLRGDKGKTPMIAVVQRGGKVVARVIDSASKKNLLGTIRKHVVPGSVIYTDDLNIYHNIPRMRGKWGHSLRYTHYRVRHQSGQYVRDGHIHTNSVEGFWSLVKRGIGGVYHSVSPKYLQTYLNEYCFRYNRRFEGNQQFRAILEQVSLKAS
ncbi:MAG: IS1595 family transposase [Candidatus Acidiferrales bacterium]